MTTLEAQPDSATAQTTTVAVVVGCGNGALPPSDRAAATLAATQFAGAVVCCPSADEPAMRYAVAAGCTGGIRSLEECDVTLYLLGRGGAGEAGDMAAARLALRIGATLVLDTLDIQLIEGKWRVTRDLGRGARERLTFGGRAVLLMSDDAPVARYVSQYRRSRVALPADFAPSDTSPASPSWQPARPRVKTADLASKTSGDAQSRMFDAFGLSAAPADAGARITGDAQACANHLVRYLAHHDFIDRTNEVVDDPLVEKQHDTSSAEVREDLTLAIAVPPPTRYPHSLERPVTGASRRPRPYRPIKIGNAKLARGPRALDGSRHSGRRGPFPVSVDKNVTHA